MDRMVVNYYEIHQAQMLRYRIICNNDTSDRGRLSMLNPMDIEIYGTKETLLLEVKNLGSTSAGEHFT